MNFPLDFSDISLWIAVTALIVLITSEVINSSTEYSNRILIDKRRMRLAAIGCGLAFLVTVIMRVI